MFIQHGLNTFGQNVNLNKLNFKKAFETEICLKALFTILRQNASMGVKGSVSPYLLSLQGLIVSSHHLILKIMVQFCYCRRQEERTFLISRFS